MDDDVDEAYRQNFALIAEVGPDVPDGVSCFKQDRSTFTCFGRRGATRITIIDNDSKLENNNYNSLVSTASL